MLNNPGNHLNSDREETRPLKKKQLIKNSVQKISSSDSLFSDVSLSSSSSSTPHNMNINRENIDSSKIKSIKNPKISIAKKYSKKKMICIQNFDELKFSESIESNQNNFQSKPLKEYGIIGESSESKKSKPMTFGLGSSHFSTQKGGSQNKGEN